ncbi:MAG TPA: elongation factor P [Patescibacteria group bacterium]|nr:elongation factor P [Patescibacteria group bacterium]
MAQLNASELRAGIVFVEDGNLWQVITYEHIKMGRGSGTIKVKAKNLRSGAITEKAFITGARVEEGDVEKKKTQYLYKEGDIYNFMDPVSFEQFTISEKILGDNAKYLYDGLEVQLIVSGEEALDIELPNSLIYEITETGPEEKGNTVSNVYKEATLSNGLVVKVPMFMHAGEKVKVDTRTGAYVERVK